MFIAMNRFKVETASEAEFEAVWRNRKSTLDQMPGYIDFKLLRGPHDEAEGYRLYASHTIWASEEDFRNWTKSENFHEAHRNAGQSKVLYKGAPQFEGFTVLEGI